MRFFNINDIQSRNVKSIDELIKKEMSLKSLYNLPSDIFYLSDQVKELLPYYSNKYRIMKDRNNRLALVSDDHYIAAEECLPNTFLPVKDYLINKCTDRVHLPGLESEYCAFKRCYKDSFDDPLVNNYIKYKLEMNKDISNYLKHGKFNT